MFGILASNKYKLTNITKFTVEQVSNVSCNTSEVDTKVNQMAPT
jgi:hypothetical protein